MNLLNNKKIFITESIWLSLLDSSHPKHDQTKQQFGDLLDGKYYIITSSYVIDSVLEELKTTCSKDIADRFLETIDRAVLGNYLKIVWLSRRLRRSALSTFVNDDSKHLSFTLNVLLMQQKNVSMVFTHNTELYNSYDFQCINS